MPHPIVVHSGGSSARLALAWAPAISPSSVTARLRNEFVLGRKRRGGMRRCDHMAQPLGQLFAHSRRTGQTQQGWGCVKRRFAVTQITN